MGIILWLIVGLIAGAIARWLMPGPDPMGWLGTMVLGVIGSLVGGTIINLITGGGFELTPAGLLGSILGSLIVLFVWRQMGRGRTAATP
ncbi:MAG TPA: GlsB/YeaQ/YmgE family stress response membrane protein [Candidatus Limnocylindria bacterium]